LTTVWADYLLTAIASALWPSMHRRAGPDADAGYRGGIPNAVSLGLVVFQNGHRHWTGAWAVWYWGQKDRDGICPQRAIIPVYSRLLLMKTIGKPAPEGDKTPEAV